MMNNVTCSTVIRTSFAALTNLVVTGAALGVALTLGASVALVTLILIPPMVIAWWLDSPATPAPAYAGPERRA